MRFIILVIGFVMTILGTNVSCSSNLVDVDDNNNSTALLTTATTITMTSRRRIENAPIKRVGGSSNKKKRLDKKQQAKKSIVGQLSFASKSSNSNRTSPNSSSAHKTTSEYDPILKKPTSSPVTRKSRVQLNNKLVHQQRNLNINLKRADYLPTTNSSSSFGTNQAAVSFGKRLVLKSNVSRQAKNRILTNEKNTLSNQCWSSPCQNGASCYGSSMSYYCQCASGFSGLNCQTKLVKKKSNY